MKDKSEKVGLKLKIQNMNITALGPIASWQIDGETMETVKDLKKPLVTKSWWQILHIRSPIFMELQPVFQSQIKPVSFSVLPLHNPKVVTAHCTPQFLLNTLQFFYVNWI